MNVTTVDLAENGVSLSIEGLSVKTVDIPSDYVPRNWLPSISDTVVLSGELLKEGMVVLIMDSLLREDPPKAFEETDAEPRYQPSDHSIRRAKTTSRWALVLNPQVRNDCVYFTAVYADGSMASRRYNVDYTWAAQKRWHFSADKEDINGLDPSLILDGSKMLTEAYLNEEKEEEQEEEDPLGFTIRLLASRINLGDRIVLGENPYYVDEITASNILPWSQGSKQNIVRLGLRPIEQLYKRSGVIKHSVEFLSDDYLTVYRKHNHI